MFTIFFLGETYLRNFLKSGSTALKIANEFLATIDGAMTIFGFILSVYMKMEFKVIKNERYEILKNSDIEAFNYYTKSKNWPFKANRLAMIKQRKRKNDSEGCELIIDEYSNEKSMRKMN